MSHINKIIRSVVTLTFAFAIALSTTADIKDGGLVTIPGRGKISIINCTENTIFEDSDMGLKRIKDYFSPRITISKWSAFNFDDVSTKAKEDGSEVVVFIANLGKKPMTLIAYEERWGIVNTSRLKEDNPSNDDLTHRVSLLVTRLCYRLLGSDSTKSPECCLYPVFDVKELDMINNYDLSAWAEMSINDSLERIGIRPVDVVTYRDACEVGLAPQPTNDIQRAIWDEVHAPPTKPLKITYDKAAQKPVVK